MNELLKLHSGQQEIFDQRTQLNAVRCGRRWGKTRLLEVLAASGALRGEQVGIFTPESKQIQEPRENIIGMTWNGIKTRNQNEGFISYKNGGKIDFWVLNDNELAGRGREYSLVLIDEAAFTKSPQMLHEIWQKSIKPTMLTTGGKTWVFSTPKGIDPDNFFYAICNDKKYGFKEFHAPTITNPFVPPEALEHERLMNDPLVFRQEYLAEFVDWSGVAFFSVDKMLKEGKPVPYHPTCDTIFAVIDTAVKGGKEHDGTGIVYFSLDGTLESPLTILDYDVVQIDGALLESWMPSVFKRIEELARITKPRYALTGVWIEDAAAGSILLQQGRINGWTTRPIDSKLTMAGKDERAFDVSGYYAQEKIKISEYAYDKVVTFKGNTRNHLLTQITGFRIGDKDAHKRADDLFDCFVYGLAIGCGDSRGF